MIRTMIRAMKKVQERWGQFVEIDLPRLRPEAATWIPATPRKNPLPKCNERLHRMTAVKVYKALRRPLASKCFLPNHYHQ